MQLARKTIVLVRHGEYEGEGLTVTGKRQASQAGVALQAMNERGLINVCSIVSSTMTRATETADIVQSHFPNISLSMEADLRERNPKVPETKERFERVYSKHMAATTSEGSTEAVLLICQGNIIRYFVCK